MIRASHPSGLRPCSNNLVNRPLAILAPESYRCHACVQLFFSNLMVASQPLYGSQHGRIRCKPFFFKLEPGGRQSNLMAFLTNPILGSPPGPSRLTKNLFHIKHRLIPHHAKSCPGQFIGQCFCSNGAVGFCLFVLIKCVGLRAEANDQVRCLHIGPG
jgi:hypothetical protein